MFRIFYLFSHLYSKKHVSLHIKDSMLLSVLLKLQYQTLKDWMLALSVAVFVSIDVLILFVYTVVEVLYGRLNAILMPNDEQATLLVGVSPLIIAIKHY